MRKPLTVETATELLHKNMKSRNLRRHCYAVGKVLHAFYEYYKEQGRDVGGLSDDEWEIVGILHDSDWELTQDGHTRHTVMLMEWLEDYRVKEEILNVFNSHNSKITGKSGPETLLEWTLECCDELTGFIVAVALVRPSKKLEDVKVKSVTKKFKEKEFARAVHREQITQCEEKVDIPLREFVDITLGAMKGNAELLGL